MRKKICWEKIVGKKCEKPFFLFSHEYRAEKMGGKTRETIFQKHTKSAVKNVGKNTSEKSANNVSIYSHEYCAEKIGGEKKARNNFSRSTRIMRTNNVGKKNPLKKVRKKRFLYSHEYRD